MINPRNGCSHYSRFRALVDFYGVSSGSENQVIYERLYLDFLPHSIQSSDVSTKNGSMIPDKPLMALCPNLTIKMMLMNRGLLKKSAGNNGTRFAFLLQFSGKHISLSLKLTYFSYQCGKLSIQGDFSRHFCMIPVTLLR